LPNAVKPKESLDVERHSKIEKKGTKKHGNYKRNSGSVVDTLTPQDLNFHIRTPVLDLAARGQQDSATLHPLTVHMLSILFIIPAYEYS
jgi:hypothetical protein